MSAVFMCDSCGELFSANAEGWREFTEAWDGNRSTASQFNNPNNHGAMTRHIGPCCNLKSAGPKPRLAITPKDGE
jgi:hypothetical protein